MDRSLRLTTIFRHCVLALLAPGLLIQAADADSGLRLVAGGTLQRVSENGQVRYHLIDEQGNVAFEVSARGRLELANFLGEQVEVVGVLHPRARGELRELRAAQIERTDRVVPAYFVQISHASSQPEVRLVAEQQPADRTRSSLEAIPLDAPPSDFPDLPEFSELPSLPELPPLTDPLVNEPGSVLLRSPEPIAPWDDFDVYQNPSPTSTACGPRHWIWGQSELLYWDRSSTRIPALVTTSPPGTSQQDAGVLGMPTTTILLGEQGVLGSGRGGFRWVFGGWFEPTRRLGMQLDYIGLADANLAYRAESNGVDILARPFTNVDPALGSAQGPDSELISFPNVTAGSISVDGQNRLRSLGIYLRGNIMYRNGCFFEPGRPCEGSPSGYRLDLLGGYRYLGLKDDLSIRSLTAVSVTPQAGFDVLDQFRTDNNFQGGELGLWYQYYRHRWTADGDLRLALGRTAQKVAIAGSTEFSMVGVENPFDGGLLALPTNEGNYSRKETDLITEFGLTVGYLLTSNLKITGGYRVIYWPRVIRVGDTMNLTVNGSYIPDPLVTPAGPLEPSFAFRSTSFWAHGLSLGLDYRW
jgi:hypothetical protein